MMLKSVAIALLAAALGFVLSEEGYRGKRLFSAVAIVTLLGLGFLLLSEAAAPFESLITETGLGDAARCAVKIVGMGYVFGIASDLCREMGESGVASALTAVGRLEIFILVLPYVLEMVDVGMRLIK